MPTPPAPTIAADRLYGISLRPQELALHGELVSFNLRYGPIYDDPTEVTTKHFKLLVLEATTPQPVGESAGAAPAERLQLMKCGWEIELTVVTPAVVGSLPELAEEVPLLLGRIADTVNELARRAKLEAPLGPDVVKALLDRYRSAK